MHAADVKPNPAASPEPTKDVKVGSIDSSNREGPLHPKNATELSEAMQALEKKVIVLDFFATWCTPCRVIGPKLAEFQQNYPNVAVVKIDVDEAEELIEKYEVTVVPTFVAFKDGDKVETLIGSDISKIEDFFKKYNSQ